MSATIYQIAKWSQVYETSESKRHKTLAWVSMPIDFGSNGYQSLVDEFDTEAPAMYGAWCALVGVAAQAPTRGILASSKGVPYTAARIARMTCFPADVFVRLLKWASSQGVEWLEVVQPPESAQDSPSTDPGDAQPPPKDDPGKAGLPNTTPPNNTPPNQTNSHTHSAHAKNEIKIAEGFETEWQRWLDFRESIDGRRPSEIQTDVVLMDLDRRGPEKAKRDIEFSILKNAKSILDSDHDFQKPRAAQAATKPPPKQMTLTERLKAEGRY